ncbi:MAG: putative lipid II flippase FtsW [Candidatus Kerfeldbacteria bacterium]|nr:putative lipid II flippase FtsW [Candidatus Kerfeldbacteria bacterium]
MKQESLSRSMIRNRGANFRDSHKFSLFGDSASWHPVNQKLVIALAVLVVIGILMLTSASNFVAWKDFEDLFFYVKRQLLYGVFVGVIGLIVVSRIDYHLWRKFAFAFMVITLVLLILVFLPGLGLTFGGSQSWVNLGIISFQPAELAKLTFLIYLATWLTNQQRKDVSDFSTSFVPFATIFGAVALLIVLQKDYGTLTVFAAMALVVFYVAGGSLKHLLVLAVACSILFLLLIQASEARVARFTVFLHPEADPQGIGYQVNQAKLAIGSGGILGLGFGQSRQKFEYIPEVAGDSIFAVIGEELGFILTSAIVILYAWFILQILSVGRFARDDFGKLLCVGIAIWIGFQGFVNIAGMLSLLPLTGLPLPFISYGNTSMVTLMLAVGIILNISRQTVGTAKSLTPKSSQHHRRL